MSEAIDREKERTSRFLREILSLDSGALLHIYKSRVEHRTMNQYFCRMEEVTELNRDIDLIQRVLIERMEGIHSPYPPLTDAKKVNE